MIVFILPIALLAVFVTALCAYYGAFTSISVKKENIPDLWIVYETFRGPYKDTGPVSDRIYYDLLNKDSLETYKGFGIYYDNPQETDPKKCRSIIGCIVEERDYRRIEEIKSEYNIAKIPGGEAVSAIFPFRGKLSILFGIFRVYPALNRYLQGKQTAVMEIYNVPQKCISYITAPEIPFKEFEEF